VRERFEKTRTNCKRRLKKKKNKKEKKEKKIGE
jgi:hypothetical protein